MKYIALLLALAASQVQATPYFRLIDPATQKPVSPEEFTADIDMADPERGSTTAVGVIDDGMGSFARPTIIPITRWDFCSTPGRLEFT